MNDAPTGLPSAVVRPRRSTWQLWILPVLTAALTAGLVVAYFQERGHAIAIRFQDGYGLKAGDYVKYRGITVGVVDDLELASTLDHVDVHVRLRPDAKTIAVDGSRFWIVRPQVSLSGPTGLETVLGAKYISVIPGGGSSQSRFVGLEAAPLLDLNEPGGVNVILTASSAGSLVPGAFVSYRQVAIGVILGVGHAPDFTGVEITAYIHPRFRHLARENARFWRSGGARVKAGLFSGIQFDVDSVHSLVLGGVSMAAAPGGNELAEDGARFVLHDEPDKDWLEWAPALPAPLPPAR